MIATSMLMVPDKLVDAIWKPYHSLIAHHQIKNLLDISLLMELLFHLSHSLIHLLLYSTNPL